MPYQYDFSLIRNLIFSRNFMNFEHIGILFHIHPSLISEANSSDSCSQQNMLSVFFWPNCLISLIKKKAGRFNSINHFNWKVLWPLGIIFLYITCFWERLCIKHFQYDPLQFSNVSKVFSKKWKEFLLDADIKTIWN